MSAPSTTRKTGNPILDNPGIVATVAATIVGVGFVLALYVNVSGHSGGHGEGHGEGHQAAPAETAHH